MRLTLSVALTAAVCIGYGQTRWVVNPFDGVTWLGSRETHVNWSFGVCVVDQGVPNKEYDLKNPSYGSWQFYPNSSAWADDAVRTLRWGGFNTVGAWSDTKSLLGSSVYFEMATPILHCGSSAGFPWTDMWDPALVKIASDVTQSTVKSLGTNWRLVGYFSDNELGWWRPALFEWVWKQKTHFTRHRAIAVLKSAYGGSWAHLIRDFDPVSVKGWSELESSGALKLRPGGQGQKALSAVQSMLANRYYELCRYLIKREDSGALYLGDRYISNYYPEVAQAAGRYCDVVSTNLNANWNDGGFVRYHMETLEKLTKRPLMVTEFYLCSSENRSGNKNDRSGFPVAKTLADRARGASNTLRALAGLPYVVGAHWFQYYDEPQNGRGDGENYNFGLVDVHNQPYAELLNAFHNVDWHQIHESSHLPVPTRKPLPRTPRDSADMTKWDRDAAFLPCRSAIPRGDLYAAWTPNGLDVRAYWSEERFTEAYFRNGVIPKSERTSIQIDIPATGFHWSRLIDPLHGKDPADPLKSVAHIDSASWLSLQIPAKAFGRSSLQPGSRIRMRVRLVSQTRAYATEWNVDRTL